MESDRDGKTEWKQEQNTHTHGRVWLTTFNVQYAYVCLCACVYAFDKMQWQMIPMEIQWSVQKDDMQDDSSTLKKSLFLLSFSLVHIIVSVTLMSYRR